MSDPVTESLVSFDNRLAQWLDDHARELRHKAGWFGFGVAYHTHAAARLLEMAEECEILAGMLRRHGRGGEDDV
jgi:hypothetical protein